MTIEDIRDYCIDRGLTDGTLYRIAEEYGNLMFELNEKDKRIEDLRDQITNLETELKVQNKLREKAIEPYKQELERFQRAAKYRMMNKEKATPVGEWIYEDKVVGKRYYRCSNCTKGVETLADEDEAKWWRFCPRCGSKMFTKDKEEKEND